MYLCAFSFVFCTLLMSAENICHEADMIPYRLLFCRSICIHMQCTGIHRNICMECFLPVHTACNGEDADAFPLCAKHHMTADASVAVNKRYADDLSLHLHTRKCFFLHTQMDYKYKTVKDSHTLVWRSVQWSSAASYANGSTIYPYASIHFRFTLCCYFSFRHASSMQHVLNIQRKPLPSSKEISAYKNTADDFSPAYAHAYAEPMIYVMHLLCLCSSCERANGRAFFVLCTENVIKTFSAL